MSGDAPGGKVLPNLGEPIMRTLCEPAAVTSSPRFACSRPFPPSKKKLLGRYSDGSLHPVPVRLHDSLTVMLRVSVKMGYRSNQDLIWFRYIVQSVGKPLYEATPCLLTDLGPCFRHKPDSVNCRFHFLKKPEAQTRQLVIIIPDSFVQLKSRWGEEADLQRSCLFLISSQSVTWSSPRL